MKNLLTGTTLIEDEFGAVNRLLSKQISEFASSSGKTVCFLEQNGTARFNDEESSKLSDYGSHEPTENIESSGTGLSNSVVFSTEEKYFPLEKLDFDLIVFQSFSSYLFGRSDQDVVNVIQEIINLAADGKRSFILTSENLMLSDRVNGYLRASVDSLIIVRSEITQGRINRTLFIPKLKGGKQYDRLIKITMDEDRVEVDTREFVG